MELFRTPSWCNSSAKQRLNRASICGLAMWMGAFLIFALLLMTNQLVRSIRADDGLTTSVCLSVSFRFLLVLLACVGGAAYIAVSARTARPMQLHAHGALFMLMLPENVLLLGSEVMHREHLYIDGWVLSALAYGAWGARRVLLTLLMMQKMDALRSPCSPCADIRCWGQNLIAATLLCSVGGVVPANFVTAGLLLRGLSYEEILHLQYGLPENHEVTMIDQVALIIFSRTGFFCGAASVVAGVGFMVAAWRLTRQSLQKLLHRQVMGELLDKVRRTLWQHLMGVLISMISSNLLILATAVDSLNMQGAEEGDDAMVAMVHFIDGLGDIFGILLLSGIGVLLVHEDPDAGDISGRIRDLLHSAVLTSRADIAFEGRVAPTSSNCCIASFPGKFLPEWNALTWLCEHGDLSSACVFLPTTDAKQRFGKHTPCPDTPGKCWCHSLYGTVKPWGCLWFDHWRSNIEEAVKLRLDLVVVYFPGQVGLGQVSWDDLHATNLWNGVGLGGSQKAEAAYLKRMGYSFFEEDLDSARLRFGVKT